MKFETERVSHQDACKFFDRFEHLGNVGLGVWHWGTFHNGQLVSVVSYGTVCFSGERGSISIIARQNGVAVYQLCRGGTVPIAPKCTASGAVSRSNRAFRRLRGDCLVVAYADARFSEVGTIYQACNAIYTGKTNPKNQADYIIHGKKMSGWSVRKAYGTRAMERLRVIDANTTKIPLSRKYRYVFVLAGKNKKKNIRAELLEYSAPYPKRDAEGIPSMRVSQLIKRRVKNEVQ